MNTAPWRIGMRNGHNVNVIYAEDGKDAFTDTSIASVFGLPQNCTLSEIEGNPRWADGLKRAQVIAAAPELLEALKSLLNYENLGAYERSDARKQARAAIAKAQGSTT